MIKKYIFIIATPLMALAASFLFLFASRDVDNYRSLYEIPLEISLESMAWVEPFFLIIFYHSNNLGFSFELLSLIIVSLAIFSKSVILYKYSQNYLASIIVFLPWFFLLQDSTQLRIAIALVFVLLAFISLSKDKVFLFFVWVLLGSLFHYSVLMFLILYFSVFLKNNLFSKLSYKKYLFALLLLSICIGLSGGLASVLISFVPDNMALKLGHYIEKGVSVSFFSLKAIFSFVVILFFLVNFRRLACSKIELLALHAFIMGFLVYSIFLDIAVLSVRGSEIFFLFLVFLAPVFFRSFKEKELSMFFLIIYFSSFVTYYFLIEGLFHVQIS